MGPLHWLCVPHYYLHRTPLGVPVPALNPSISEVPSFDDKVAQQRRNLFHNVTKMEASSHSTILQSEHIHGMHNLGGGVQSDTSYHNAILNSGHIRESLCTFVESSAGKDQDDGLHIESHPLHRSINRLKMTVRGLKSCSRGSLDESSSSLLNSNAMHHHRSLDMHLQDETDALQENIGSVDATNTDQYDCNDRRALVEFSSPLQVLSPSFATHQRRSVSPMKNKKSLPCQNDRPPIHKPTSRTRAKAVTFRFP